MNIINYCFVLISNFLGGSGSSSSGQGGSRPSTSQHGIRSSSPNNNSSKINNYSKANSIDAGISRTNHSHNVSSDITDAHSAASIGKNFI